MKINDNGIEREMTETEQEAYEMWAKVSQAEDKEKAKTLADRAKARKVLLERLNITLDEAALILG